MAPYCLNTLNQCCSLVAGGMVVRSLKHALTCWFYRIIALTYSDTLQVRPCKLNSAIHGSIWSEYVKSMLLFGNWRTGCMFFLTHR